MNNIFYRSSFPQIFSFTVQDKKNVAYYFNFNCGSCLDSLKLKAESSYKFKWPFKFPSNFLCNAASHITASLKRLY